VNVVQPRPAAAVVLVREAAGGGIEVYLVRRHARSGFMGGAYVFPGGAADAGEDDLRVTAARELAEECGVQVAPGALRYLAHWITPSVEPKRFSAVFYLAVLPDGQTPAFDARETVDEVWVTPEQGLARAAELHLPPPQIRTLEDIAEAARAGVDALIALCEARAAAPQAILPRPCATGAGFALLLPWDPDYESLGQGEALPVAADHPLATGATRFVLEGTAWKHIAKPSSPRED
jgi:8-oxo-dGTP pyrophosphatase MutT (NUDIX family)